jgi:hypothetical protein
MIPVFEWDLNALNPAQGIVAGFLVVGASIVLGFALFDLGRAGANVAAGDDYDEYLDEQERRQRIDDEY